MKTIKLISAMMLLATVTFCFNACSDDDDNLNNLLSGKQISEMNVEFESNSTYQFQYENGKLVKMFFDGMTANIIYSGKKVTIAYGGEFEQTLQLNNQGFVESGTFESYGEYASKETFTCEYSNGYIRKVHRLDTYWSVDIITIIEYDGNNNILAAYRIDEGIKDRELKFTPSNYPCKGKTTWLFGGKIGQLDDFEHLLVPYYAGLLGKDPKNLVSKIELIERANTDRPASYDRECEYTFDNDGYVNTMEVKMEDYSNTLMSFSFVYK